MPEGWTALPLDRPLYANLDEDAVVGFMTAVENGFQNELGGHTRFPGLIERVNFGGSARVYLHDFDGDMISCDARGRVHRMDRSLTATDVTGLTVSGGRRPVFAKTDRELLIAAGGPIVRLRDRTTELLSSAAPDASHVAWLDNFTIAVEINSGRFFHSGAGTPDQWDPLDTFAADGNPDNINSLIVTPTRELLLGGANSIEQFERNDSGDPPFFRRWAVGGGTKLPYAILFAENQTWTINKLTQFVTFAGQATSVKSAAIGRLLEKIDDWSEAWIGGYPDAPLHLLGQQFIVIQAPNATNSYGTKGVTLLYDYRNERWSSLYGWDSDNNGLPTRWSGWSHWRIWDKIFVGGNGKIYELTDETYRNGTEIQRWLVRTSHQASGSGAIINNFRLRVKRGIGGSSTKSDIMVRCSRDGRPFGSWLRRSLGKAGERLQFVEFGSFGGALTFRWEISCTDDCAVDLISAEIKATSLGH